MNKRLIISAFLVFFVMHGMHGQKTWCNPLNLDYGYCPIPDFTIYGKHRATADPVIVNFKGDYDDLCAPAVWVQGDTLLVFGSTYSAINENGTSVNSELAYSE